MGEQKRKEQLKEEYAQMDTILYDPANIEIKKFSFHKQDKILCIYVPATWPFVHAKFFENFIKITNLANIGPLRRFGITDYFIHLEKSFPICKNRNEAVLYARKHKADLIMFLDIDMSHPPDLIYRLAQHQLPIVAGMYFHKTPPHMPVLLNKKEGHEYEHYYNYPRDHLFDVDLTGLGCMLVDMRVFDDITLPYFGYASSRDDGIVDISEDVLFCEKVKEKGFSIMIDPSVQCSHYAVVDVSAALFDVYMKKYKTYQELLKIHSGELDANGVPQDDA
jgi:hypothetical protein